jgi:hypothetical protein
LVQHEELDVGTGATRKQETKQVYGGNNRKAEQHKDKHCVQKVVILDQHIHSSDKEHHLRYKVQKYSQYKEKYAIHKQSHLKT